MRVLIACEFFGVVREAFKAKGHDAWSCDLLPTKIPGNHFKCDVRLVLDKAWDMLICHPDCTYLSSSGLHWNKKDPSRQAKTEEALEFVNLLLNAPVDKIALENPVGCIGTRIRPADQYIQPHEFGHNASKKTGLWLKNLPKLQSTKQIDCRIVEKNGKRYKRWANQTDSGQNRLGPSEDRWALRAKTYQGIADAMAEQWGGE